MLICNILLYAIQRVRQVYYTCAIRESRSYTFFVYLKCIMEGALIFHPTLSKKSEVRP